MASTGFTARHRAAAERRARIEWQPAEPVRLRLSRAIRRSVSEVEKALRNQPEEVVCLAYPQAGAGSDVVISLAPYEAVPYLQVPVRVQIMTPSPDKHGVIISILWEAARAERFFPQLVADLSIKRDQAGHAELVLDARYTPPLGVAGALIDLAAGRAIAAATITSFLDKLAESLETGLATDSKSA